MSVARDQHEQANRLLAMIEDLRARGFDERQAIAMLEQQGIPRDMAATAVRHVYPPPDFLNRPLSSKAIFWAVVIFVGINACLYFAPEIFAREALQRCEVLAADLNTREVAILALENSLRDRQREIEAEEGALTSLQAIIESRSSHGSERDGYNLRVNHYNSTLESYNADLTHYQSLVSLYNERVHEYNSLLDKLPPRSLLFPGLGKALSRAKK